VQQNLGNLPQILIFDDNVTTTNARWPIKGSRDANFRPAYFERKNMQIAT